MNLSTTAVLLLLCYCFHAEPIRTARRNEKASSLEEPVVLRTNEPVRDAHTSSKTVGAISMEKSPVSHPHIHVKGKVENDGYEHSRLRRSPDNDEEEPLHLERSRLRSNVGTIRDKRDRPYKYYDQRSTAKKSGQNRIESKVDEIYQLVQPHEKVREKDLRINNIESEADQIYQIVQPYEKVNEKDLSMNNIESEADQIYQIVQPYEKVNEKDLSINNIESEADQIYQIVQPYEKVNEKDLSINNIESEADQIYQIVQPYEKVNEKDLSINNIESEADQIYQIVRPYGEEYEEVSRVDPSFESELDKIYQIVQRNYSEEERSEDGKDAFRGKSFNFNIFIIFDFGNHEEKAEGVSESSLQIDAGNIHNLREADSNAEE